MKRRNHKSIIMQIGEKMKRRLKSMKKRIYIFCMLLCMSGILAACGGETANNPEDAKKTEAENVREAENTPAPMREMTSMDIIHDMGLGWNLGDTLDVCVADRDGDGKVNETPANGIVDETLWGNGKTTKEMIDKLKADGIKSIRIPVTWRDHLGEAPDYKIDEDWMNRVEEVVRYVYDNDMYAIINLHHDGGGDPAFGAWIRNASKDKAAVMEKYKAVWSQIAERFKNYSDYLIFESMNEVGFDDMDLNDAYALLNEFNQTFVDLIRQSGGNNAKRHLLIAGYWTDIAMTCDRRFKMPEDLENRLILSVHYYTPWTFCTTDMKKTWGSETEVQEMEGKVKKLEDNFIRKNIPVLIGEYGTGPNDTVSCIYFCEKFVKLCRNLGIPTFLWDNGGQFDRAKLEWRTDGLLDAIKKAASGEEYEVKKQEPAVPEAE